MMVPVSTLTRGGGGIPATTNKPMVANETFGYETDTASGI